VPAKIVDRARLVVLDTLGVQVAAGSDPVIAAVARSLAEQGRGGASAVTCEAGLPPAQAAFVNGLASAWLDFDEVSFEARQHPAIHVVPAALAVAEHVGASGASLLAAIIAGYEIGGRVGRASTPRPGLMHPHGIHGTVGAAVAAGKLLGQGAQQLAETMRIASAMTVATSWQAGAEGATVRHAYVAQGAQNGVLAALLGEAGVIGETNGLATVFGRVSGQAFEPTELCRGLGSEYLLATNLFKSYGCGADSHPAVEAVRRALAGRLPAPEEIVSTSVWVHAQAARLAAATSHNAHVARLSLPYVMARTLRAKSLGLEAFEKAARTEPATQALMQRVRVHEDPSATAAHPHEQRARAEIVLSDGSILAATFVLDPAGRAAWPTREGVKAKFLAVTSRALDEAHSHALMHEVERLDDGGNPLVIGALLRSTRAREHSEKTG
jgi:2-methylcitrate dehydratase PrpD